MDEKELEKKVLDLMHSETGWVPLKQSQFESVDIRKVHELPDVRYLVRFS